MPLSGAFVDPRSSKGGPLPITGGMEPATLAHPSTETAPRSATRVSIILVANGQPGLLLRSLISLTRLPDELGFEVVVVENARCAQTERLLTLVAGDLRRMCFEPPVARAVACDAAAATAAGNVVCFLREDAVPVDGWLAPLLGALKGDPCLGAVMARASDPLGRVLEEPQWGAIAIRKAAFDEVRGFGGSSQPCRWEGVTLLEAIRARGWAIASEPSSVVLLLPEG